MKWHAVFLLRASRERARNQWEETLVGCSNCGYASFDVAKSAESRECAMHVQGTKCMHWDGARRSWLGAGGYGLEPEKRGNEST